MQKNKKKFDNLVYIEICFIIHEFYKKNSKASDFILFCDLTNKRLNNNMFDDFVLFEMVEKVVELKFGLTSEEVAVYFLGFFNGRYYEKYYKFIIQIKIFFSTTL